MDTIIALRRDGKAPSCVMVDLVPQLGRPMPSLSTSGIATVEIPRSDSLSDLDFRPLVGLHVQVFDYDNADRHRKVCALIARANPRLLVMHTAEGESYTAHVRTAGDPPTTRSYHA